MPDATRGSAGNVGRLLAVPRRLRTLRWRLAERIGRALLGGRLTAVEAGLARAGAALEAVQTHLEVGDAQLAVLAAEVVALRGRDTGATDRLAQETTALTARLDGLLDERARIAETLHWHSRSIRWLAERPPPPGTALPTDGPLLSVVMPVWNRAAMVGAAVESVRAQTYTRWELVVVDDGSEDDTAGVVAPHLTDDRVRYLRLPHGGEVRARNRALAECHGEIVTYLDSDNTWRPEYLAAVAAALSMHPESDTAYTAQLVADHRNDGFFIRGEPFDRARLRDGNYIDLNSFAHRRSLVERCGAFDETLTRLSDWDLILRYTAERDPLVLDVLGGRYEFGRSDSVSRRRSFAANAYRIRRKLSPPVPATVRVLYALWHYPQLSESYVRAETAGLRRRGIAVEAWSETDGCAPFAPEIPIHRGTLTDAIAAARPTVVHTHWLQQGLAYREAVARAGLPLTVRGHGFEFDPAAIRTLVADPTVRGVYLFPHFAGAVAGLGSKVRAMPICFDPDRYPPADRKDPRLVVRVAAALATKDLETVFEVARMCPAYRFVLAVSRASRHEAYADVLVAKNRALGNPVDLRIDLQHEEVAALVGEAGVYLHTHGLVEPYGMPISIAEAMATGCHVVARRCIAAEGYVGEVGSYYDTPAEAAARIRETGTWDDEQWHRARLASVERAYNHFTDTVALRPLLDDWMQLARP